MAFEYQNYSSLGVNLNRQKYGPLDISNVFANPADFQYYITKGTYTTGVSTYWYTNETTKVTPYPYTGQVVSVIDGTEVHLYLITNADLDTCTYEEIGTSSAGMLFVATEEALKTPGTPPNGVPNDLELGQQAWVSSNNKIYTLTEIGTPGDVTSYEWEVQSSDAPVWNDTNQLVNFYVTDWSTYNSLGSKDGNTLYFLSDAQKIFKGTQDVTSSIVVITTPTTNFPEVTNAFTNKLYIDTTTFEVRITTDKQNWINVSPGYITDGSNWAQTTDDSKLATVGAIKAGIGASFIAKLGTGEANVIITATADGGIQRTSAKIGGATLAGTTDANTLATEAAVETAIEAGTANKVDKVTGTVGNAMEFGADGAIVDSGMAFGGATLGASPNATTLATEAAVEDAISWKTLTSE